MELSDSRTKTGSQLGRIKTISAESDNKSGELFSLHLHGSLEGSWQGGIFFSVPMDFSQIEIEFSQVLAHKICPSKKNARMAAQIRFI